MMLAESGRLSIDNFDFMDGGILIEGENLEGG
jgi:hypothetical protein